MMAGRLKHLISIEHIDDKAVSPTGEERARHVSFTTRADVKWGAAQRKNLNGEIVYYYDVTFIVWLFHRNRVNPYDRVSYDGRSFLIEGIEPDIENNILYLRCREE